jgi:predicted RNA-binding protein with RPS1 domain
MTEKATVTKITLEDCGQDFLEWYVRNGIVIDCQPFQGFVWVGASIHNTLKVGQKPMVSVLCNPDEKSKLNYKIEKLEVLSAEEATEVEGYGRKWAESGNIKPELLGL